ncbi:HTH-type transcriptional repressor CytR [Pontiella desulfatans]|uniref:HTH-type transcriptional repressor CytR n=1 Tax=Pontiella desulfatans TaxID=2750659 RepID=A0A6C2U818_PONDE|nr:LacI family DNA-binding transcriptional regulator [Pontiella desulfatans]VGO16252.1 HTH-type transcriptional repressor CytR [Pontiella desulfatans]
MGFDGVNLSEIAERLNISISTVSRAIRNLKGVHPATRNKVVEVAREMGYGKTLEDEHTGRTILVLAQTSGGGEVQDYLSGISRAAVGANVSVLTHCLPLERCEELLDPKMQPPALRCGQVDGIIFLFKWPDSVVAKLEQSFPVVSMVHEYNVGPMDRVGIDHQYCMNILIDHLVELGHQRIGFFGLCPEVSWSCSRYSAYIESLVRRNYDVNLNFTTRLGFSELMSVSLVDVGHVVSGLKKNMAEGMTAVVCSGDMPGYSLMETLLSEGIRIPQDLSITGFHAAPPQNGLPELTTVSISSEEMGVTILRRMVRRLENPVESLRTILHPCRLRIGATTSAQ